MTMTSPSTSPTLWGRLGLAVLSTAVLAIAHRAEAQPLLSVDDFYATQADTQVLVAALQGARRTPLVQAEVALEDRQARQQMRSDLVIHSRNLVALLHTRFNQG